MASEMSLLLIASLLRRGRQLDQLSTGLTLLGLAGGLLPMLIGRGNLLMAVPCVLLILFGLLQKYWAIRTALDAELFAVLAADPLQREARLAELDSALVELHLQPASQISRPWDARIRGARRLLRMQGLWLAAQLLLALIMILVVPWFSFAG
ncbi:MAG TPA: hypothetical protein VLC30_18220 [Pseudomonas sp.]|nr:hypothetical protein [Pseudomonas sp.]